MNKRVLAVALASMLASPAFSGGQVEVLRAPPRSPDFTDFGGGRGYRRSGSRLRSRGTRKRSTNEAYKAQRAANRDRRRRGA